MQFKKRICIIGAGVSGITSAKACLEENFEPYVLEKTDYIAGLWRYQDKVVEDGIASVMRSTVINTSKEMSAFSDYPVPPNFSNYMHNTKMAEYLDNYADSFGFRKYVHFKIQVTKVELADDYEETGRWKVTYHSVNTKEEKTEVFDGVMICTGHHNIKNMPTFPGQEKFKGKIMHTHDLKHSSGFENKNCVVVGIGNSGGDAAVELSTVTKELYLSTRRGTWVAKRVGENGFPNDGQFIKRYWDYIMKLLPYDASCAFMENRLNAIMDHDAFQLRPSHRVFSQHIMINDALPNKILSGTVKVKGDIDHFTENGVVFQGEKEETPVDIVVLATGYRFEYPFIPADILRVRDNSVRLFKFMFIPHLKHAHTLCVIGLIQPIGCIFTIAEIQARWYAQLMAGNVKLPTKTEMEAEIDRKLQEMKKRYYGSNRHTIQVDWIPYMDEIASQFGAKPPVWKYLFTDWKLFKCLIFDPASAYQYRLVGPHKWDKARQTQLTIQQRIVEPLKTNKTYINKKQASKSNFTKHILIILTIFTLIFYFIFLSN